MARERPFLTWEAAPGGRKRIDKEAARFGAREMGDRRGLLYKTSGDNAWGGEW